MLKQQESNVSEFYVANVSCSSGPPTMDSMDCALAIPDIVHKLTPFCPHSLCLVPSVGSSRMLEGCVMLADISGFTQLSSTLSSEGLTGIDKLRLVTNSSLAEFVKVIYDYDGDGKQHIANSVES